MPKWRKGSLPMTKDTMSCVKKPERFMISVKKLLIDFVNSKYYKNTIINMSGICINSFIIKIMLKNTPTYPSTFSSRASGNFVNQRKIWCDCDIPGDIAHVLLHIQYFLSGLLPALYLE